MSDALMNGQGCRTFNIVDDCSREALALEIDTSLPTARVNLASQLRMRTLNDLTVPSVMKC